ncbi:putative minchromosome maintenance (MCM) complex subunit [Trypanosoma vivax]|nr:putative minchromosome maintenance (MCM) complex subunit [Trypanosoma vivax]
MRRDSLVEMTPVRPESTHSPVRGLQASAARPPSFARREDLSYIWGTGIAVETFREEFQRFLETFELPQNGSADSNGNRASGRATETGALRGGSKKYFLQELLRLRLQNQSVLELDLQQFSRSCTLLYQQLIAHPMECVPMMESVAEEVSGRLVAAAANSGVETPDGDGDEFMLRIALKNHPEITPLRGLSPRHVEQLVALQGMVVRVSKIIPEIRVAFFQCWQCQHVRRSVVYRGRIFEPTRCDHCGRQYSYRINHNLSLFEDKQIVRLQEAPEHLGDGDTPVTISIVVYGDSVDTVVPGDRVVVTGIYRAAPVRLNANTRIIRSIFSTHIDAIHIEHRRAGRSMLKSGAEPPRSRHSSGGGEGTPVDPAEEARHDMFRCIASRPDIYNIILNSFARTIWGNEEVKRGILLQLFGGTRKELKSGTFRSEINIILCGDPGVAKSQLLTQVHEIAPRGVYTSGKGSSGAGLTAFVVQSGETGELVLEPGALVLSDRGLCCIDEFDKMNEATRSVLHEVMEQQTLSIAKAGIIAQLNARTSVLAAANPKESQWNMDLNVVENLQIEPTLLSRFDLIFLLLDRHDQEEDRRLASHVLSLFMESGSDNPQTRDGNASGDGTAGVSSVARVRDDDALSDDNGFMDDVPGSDFPNARVPVILEHDGEVFLEGTPDKPYMPTRILSQYIAFARETVHPRLTEASHKQLAASYVEMRRARGSSRAVSATLRQLESMIRLAEARSKMRFGAEVTVEDVQEAKWLISAALKEAATDPRTGRINLDMFSAPDPTRQTVEGSLLRLERVIEQRFIASGHKTATVNELRLALNESLGPGVRPLSVAQFMELLSFMAGGTHVKSFTLSRVTFAEKSG